MGMAEVCQSKIKGEVKAMTTKATLQKTPAESTEPILYDSRSPQRIPLELEKSGQTFRLYHNLQPLSNDRYCEFQNRITELATRIKKLTTAILEPQHELWKELIDTREGYKERADWKEATHTNDAVAVITALLMVQVLENNEIEPKEGAPVYDEAALHIIAFRAMQSGALLTLSHSFREETKAEADEFLAIEANQSDDNNLASHDKVSKQERLYRLGKKLLQESDGYAEGSEVPAWHLAVTTETFFARQAARMGKFLMP